MTPTPVIAIVDDDAAVRQALGSLLRSIDMDVELHASGNDLLQSRTIDAISCLVTDVQMPTMNGFALCEALRTRGLSIPVIFMTAFQKECYLQRAASAAARKGRRQVGLSALFAVAAVLVVLLVLEIAGQLQRRPQAALPRPGSGRG
ncbi:response regulator [Cupriavidus sp. CuC1]|uniref:response regulator n=1 Tax=Cupriavidus sp. CuC1 TaxID=3373131 RepID=UPI0037D69B74